MKFGDFRRNFGQSIGAEDKQLNLMDMKAVNMAVRLLYT